MGDGVAALGNGVVAPDPAPGEGDTSRAGPLGPMAAPSCAGGVPVPAQADSVVTVQPNIALSQIHRRPPAGRHWAGPSSRRSKRSREDHNGMPRR